MCTETVLVIRFSEFFHRLHKIVIEIAHCSQANVKIEKYYIIYSVLERSGRLEY